MQGQAFLVTFCAIAKSDWPRAAMERAGGTRVAPFSRPFAALRANGGMQSTSFHEPPHPNPLPRGERDVLLSNPLRIP